MGLQTALTVLVLVSAVTAMPPSQKVESFQVISDIRYRFATTQMVSVVRNTADEDQEITFAVTLPKEAFIMHFEMAIDGKVYEGEVKEKKAAKQQYTQAVDRGESAGHVAQTARHANLFDVSVNIASGSAVNFTLTYQELLRRKLGLYNHEIHVSPGQPVEDFLVKVFIKDKEPITSIRTPSLKKDYLLSNNVDDMGPKPEFVTVNQRHPTSAYIEYAPAMKDQGENGLDARLMVQFDVHHNDKGDLMVVDGYFVHFFAPGIPPMPKDIVFVLDKSGSMGGKKIRQLKDAMKTILNDLSPDDRFNIISFSTNNHAWKPELSPADDEFKAEASTYVESIGAHGGTNINGALLEAVNSLRQRDEEMPRAPIIFFLTDGQPTAGVTGSTAIKNNIYSRNEGEIPIISLAFGDDADYELLKGISAQNSGFARKIYEAADSALQVSSLYKEISSVILKDLRVEYLNSSVDQFTVTQQDFPVVFNGSEVVICGLLREAAGPFEMDITARQREGELDLKFETENVEHFFIEEPEEDSNLFNSPRDYAGIVERMWAFLNIKQKLKEREKEVGNTTESERLKKEIIDMAVKYKFVTPLTSMVVTKPEQEGRPRETLESGLTDVDDVKQSASYSRAMSMTKKISGRPLLGRRYYGHKRPGSWQAYLPTQYDMDPMDALGPSGASVARTMRPDRHYSHSTALVDLPTTVSGVSSDRTSIRKNNRRRGGRGGGGKRGGGGRRGGGGKRKAWRGKKKSRGKKSKVPKVLLARIILESASGSYCMVPKRWKPGNYSLLASKGSTNFPILVAVGNQSKGLSSFSGLYTEDGMTLMVKLTPSSIWQYTGGSQSSVVLVNASLGAVVENSGKEIAKVEIMKKSRKAWLVSVTVSDELGDKGASLKKAMKPKANKKVRMFCSVPGGYPNTGLIPAGKARKLHVK